MRLRFARAAASAATSAAALARLMNQFSHINFSLFNFQFFIWNRCLDRRLRITGGFKQFLLVFFLFRFAFVRAFHGRVRLLVDAMFGTQRMRQDRLFLLVVRGLRQIWVIVLVDHLLAGIVLSQPQMPSCGNACAK